MRSIKIVLILFLPYYTNGWGFFAHQKINRIACLTVPYPLLGLYKYHITFVTKQAVQPDKRRYAIPEEAPRHYFDADVYLQKTKTWQKVPFFWKDAIDQFGDDTLHQHGIVPWHIVQVKQQLTQAFLQKDLDRILKLSADLGHYIADAHVPLHTCSNYNGQKTDQLGIHGFWESRLPELYCDSYDLFTGPPTYIQNTQKTAWSIVKASYAAVDSVLDFEKKLSKKFGEAKMFSYEAKGSQLVRVYAKPYALAYHRSLEGMVEKRMRAAIHMVASFWYTAWVDAGKPNLPNYAKASPAIEQYKHNKIEPKRKEFESYLPVRNQWLPIQQAFCEHH